MSNDQLDDLKQFISASISQSEGRIRQEMHQSLQDVRQEMADGFLGVGEANDSGAGMIAHYETMAQQAEAVAVFINKELPGLRKLFEPVSNAYAAYEGVLDAICSNGLVNCPNLI